MRCLHGCYGRAGTMLHGSPAGAPVSWDNRRCCAQSYSMMEGGEDISENLKTDRVTHYVEHPVPIQPPLEEAPAAPMPLMLTQKVLIPTCALPLNSDMSIEQYWVSCSR